MGNTLSLEDEEVNFFKFVGRQKSIKNAKKLVSKNRSVLISGMIKIGKTRFLQELQKLLKDSDGLRDWRLLWKDFELDNIESGSTQYEWFEKLYDCIEAMTEKERLQKKYPDKQISCRSCDQCRRGDRSCEKQGELLKEEINILIKHLKECQEKVILFLDNVDKIMKSSFKDQFLTFHRESILKCSTLKTVIASAYKPKQVLKKFASLHLEPLEDDDILKMFFLATEYNTVDSNDEDVNSDDDDVSSDKENVNSDKEDETVRYAPEFRVFKEENKPYIRAIVRLCDGLPLAAAMSGLLLTEDDGLLTPADLLEILICIRLKSLSPDNCPPEDRLDIYKKSMQEVEEVGSFFNNLNKHMTGSSFTIKEAVAAAGQENSTSARVKMNKIKPCLDKSILSINSLSGPEQVKWHGILRESQASLKVLNDIPEGDDSAKDMVLKFMRENVRKANLNFDDEILRDDKLLEQAILALSFKEKTPTSAESEESDEASDGDVKMNKLKEHSDDTEQFSTLSSSDSKPLSSEQDTKTVPRVTGPIAREVNQETHLDRDKVKMRYSESEASVSNSLHLEFRNVRQDDGLSVNNEFNVVSPPPPYTTLPEEQEPRERNDRSTHRNPFQHNQPNFPPVGEPPPLYSSTDQFPPVHDQRGYNTGHTMSHTYSFESGTRSRSTPTVFLPPTHPTLSNTFSKFEHNTALTSDTPDGSCGQTLRRVRSDPVCSRDCEVMKELDTSYTDSFAGPPALNYSPPNCQTQNAEGLHRVSVSSNLREQNKLTSQVMYDLKVGIHDTSLETKKAVQLDSMKNGDKGISLREKNELSTFEPAAVSYRVLET